MSDNLVEVELLTEALKHGTRVANPFTLRSNVRAVSLPRP
jgi:hypothetical protein